MIIGKAQMKELLMRAVFQPREGVICIMEESG